LIEPTERRVGGYFEEIEAFNEQAQGGFDFLSKLSQRGQFNIRQGLRHIFAVGVSSLIPAWPMVLAKTTPILHNGIGTPSMI
jgi:hypothetical protein